MSELEKKFYEYLKNIQSTAMVRKEQEAKDLTEIAFSYFDVMSLKILELQNEIIELKKQLKRQIELYLDLRDLDNKNLQEIEELKKQYANEREWKLIYSKENEELKKQKGVVIGEGEISSEPNKGELYTGDMVDKLVEVIEMNKGNKIKIIANIERTPFGTNDNCLSCDGC